MTEIMGRNKGSTEWLEQPAGHSSHLPRGKRGGLDWELATCEVRVLGKQWAF